MGALTIRNVTVHAVDAPMDPPLRNSLNVITRAPLVIAEIQTEQGPRGTAYAFAYAPQALGPLAALTRNIGEGLVGREVAPQGIWDWLQNGNRLIGAEGLVQMAISVLDMALWDALGKQAGLPLARLLGGDLSPLPAYGSLRGWGPAMLAEEAGRTVADLGLRAVKFKLGAARLEDDIATIRAVREAVGDSVEILVDYNQGLDRPEALRRGLAIQAEGVRWLEEPLHVTDDEGLAWLSSQLEMPVQGGENWWGVTGMARSLALRATDLCMPDVMKMGGVTGFLRGMALAGAQRVPLSSHIFIEASAHLLSVSPNRHYLEHLDIAGALLRERLHVKDGMALIPDRPGLGMQWDESALRHHAANA
ncbi:enolase C-terminal domain-like protein [Roseococcus sp. YIM B11640]|uniref:enolase C-terminal domain-like protein n=1 Tax=Roseococcus sp. YIM B11640 TaxID=3133973 RepID=UPI003C7CAF42